jgi:tetratricopeptide (TPR) repeat protein
MKRRFIPFLMICLLGSFSVHSQDTARVYNTSNSGLPNNSVDAIAIDNSGIKWIGTFGGGLAQFDGKNWVVYNTGNSGLSNDYIYAVVIDSEGREWVGTDNGVMCYDGSGWRGFNTHNSDLPDNYVRSLAIDASGNKWIGTYGGGLARFNGSIWAVYNTENSGLPNNHVQAISIDHEGNKWIGTPSGLVKFDGKSWTLYNTNNSGLPSDIIFALVIDEEGNTWAGTFSGLAKFGVGQWTVYNVEKSDLPSDMVSSIAIDAEGNKWVGTSRGLAKFDGANWTVCNVEKSGLPDSAISSVVVHMDGIWVGTSGGLAELSPAMPTELALAKKLITENKFEVALQNVREFFAKRKIDELGYNEEFFKAFQTLLSQGKKDDASAVVNGLGGLAPQDILATYVKLADIFTRMGDPETSITILSRVLANDPGNKEASEKLGQAYYSAGRYDEVVRVFGNNKDSEPMRYLALSYEKKSMFAQANKVWQAIVNSTHNDLQVNEANEHIKQNTIALMTTNRSQTKTEQNTIAVQPQQPTPQTTLNTKEPTPNTNQPGAAEVDSDIPQSAEEHSNAVALILAIPQYQSSSIPEVKYAKNDAEVLRQYLIKALGFKPENILPMIPDEQLTYGRIQTYIKSILPSYLKPDGSSDLFIYFTGHGAPSTANHEAYLVPWDGDPNYVNDNNSYSMKKFYVDIELLNARHKTIVVDACFSGQAGNGEVLTKSASGLALVINNPLVADPNTVIFQSSTANQVSNWYDEKRHGMFTYFFLKGLQGAADYNGDGAVTADELMKYINDQNDGLPYWSNRLYQRPQEAQLEGNGQTVIERIEK